LDISPATHVSGIVLMSVCCIQRLKLLTVRICAGWFIGEFVKDFPQWLQNEINLN
jgi:hypothetical protein